MSGPSALITGGSRGIGLGVARSMASQGWSLTLGARGENQLNRAREVCAAFGVPVQIVPWDVVDEGYFADLVARYGAAFGTMNALVIAAGVGSAGPLAGYPVSRLDKQTAVNFRVAFIVSGCALPLVRLGAMDGTRKSRVIAISSIEGIHPEPGLTAYGATKAALSRWCDQSISKRHPTGSRRQQSRPVMWPQR